MPGTRPTLPLWTQISLESLWNFYDDSTTQIGSITIEMNTQAHIRPLKDSKRSETVCILQYKHEKILKIQAYRELFTYLSPFSRKSTSLGIFLLYYPINGLFWYNFFELTGNRYIEEGIEIELKKLGYSKGDDGLYTQDDRKIYSIYYSGSSGIGYHFSSASYGTIYFLEKNIIQFRVLSNILYNNLYVRKNDKLYKTFDQAYKSIIKSIKKIIINQKSVLFQIDEEWSEIIRLKPILGQNFFVQRQRSACTRYNSVYIKKIKRIDAKWYLEIKGVNNQHATIILNENYEVLDVVGDNTPINPI